MQPASSRLKATGRISDLRWASQLRVKLGTTRPPISMISMMMTEMAPRLAMSAAPLAMAS